MNTFFSIIFSSFLFLCTSCASPEAETRVISPKDFSRELSENYNATLIDIRRPDEYQAGHIKGARPINWEDSTLFYSEVTKLAQTEPVYLYCRTGRRSAEAAQYLHKQGFNVVDLEGGYVAWVQASMETTKYESDIFSTNAGRKVSITFIKHGTLMIEVDGTIIHIDPVSSYAENYESLPKADIILVTHEHGDHYDAKAIETLSKSNTAFYSNKRVSELSGKSIAMSVGDSQEIANIKITATAAYNSSEGHENFHPKGRDVGYLLDIDDLRLYIAGDTEPIDEFSAIQNINIAFLPVNQPYTMTVEQCIQAIDSIKPHIVYPYHYGNKIGRASCRERV